MTTVADQLVYELTLASYQGSIRAAVRGLWNGSLTEGGFVDTMTSATERGLEQAWREGAAECGIGPEDRSKEEKDALRSLQNRNLGSIRSFGTAISARGKAEGEKLGPHLTRASMWVNRYNEAKNQARAMACADQKYAWRLGNTDHCSTCLKMADKVKRASQWAKADVRPQHSSLECKGYRCQCEFEQTETPLSRGRIPSMP
ncbi:hypothetical protein LCGC14_0400910 [marine sediment metagenome]|uniref:Phage head morphogenesis domain-containing protein n=1 Tax=marine sediment metagenome TaxID=412755 RepID=A0A0F9W5U8_9ZZZZ